MANYNNYNFKELENVMANWAADHGLDVGYSNDVQTAENNITCITGGVEMLRVAEDGFYVRGVKVPADDKEAETVYNAFKEFLTWSRLHRE